jgi:Zn-finger nucleic acid-binding protein
MPLLMCPNCNASMSEVKRNDVAFDMCPSCRGVWLDRGELEKIIAGVQAEQGSGFGQERAQLSQDPRQQRPQQGYGERGEYGEGGEYGERDYDQRGGQQRRRRGGFDLMDIFGD